MGSIPRLVVAGTQSGAGKTTVASGLMAALAARGLQVQGFKAGPDYIDPQCHRWATGRPGRNLDTWLMTPAQVHGCFARGAAGADVCVIEGVMGLYDGAGGAGEIGSTAHLAKLLQAPVVLVLDARASARSAAAVALGFKLLDPAVLLAGVVANRVGSDRHAQMIREALAGIGIPLLGAVHRDPDLQVPEDRLGLALPGGRGELPGWIRRAAAAVAAQVDLDQILALARATGPLPDLPEPGAGAGHGAPGSPAPAPLHPANPFAPAPAPLPPPDSFAPARAGCFAGLRVAVGLDAAFWFYYEDTFDLLRHWGALPVFFSPLRDPALPSGVHGLYLGGGFPERHARDLAANAGMRAAARAAWAAGLPILAECGGYLYLLGGLTGEDGTVYPMAGCLPGVARLQPKLQGMGYRAAAPAGPGQASPAVAQSPAAALAPAPGPAATPAGAGSPAPVRGHVFHYTRVEGNPGPPAWHLHRSDGSYERADGCRQGPMLASYLHVHHATQPGVLAGFLSACRSYKEAQARG